MKAYSARASYSEKAISLFRDPVRRLEMFRSILSGTRRFKVAGITFTKDKGAKP